METVWLRRPTPDVPWGFRLQGGRDYQQPLSVQRVTGGSVASTALTSGDLILRIANIDSDELSHNDAQDIIKNTRDVLQLTIQKGGLLTPPEPVMSSQAMPYDSYKSTPNGNVPAMSASSSDYYPYDRQQSGGIQSGYGYSSAQDGHGYQGQGYQDPNRSGGGFHSPADSLSPTRGGYQPPSYETVTNSNYGYTSPVDAKQYQRQSSQDSAGSRGYGRQNSGTMSPSYQSQGYGGSYGRTETVSPSYGEPSHGRQVNSSQQRSETMSPSYGRPEPSYGRQLSNTQRTDTMSPTYGRQTSQPQSYGYSSPTTQGGYSSPTPRSQAPAPWTYGAPLPPTETQPQYSYARQPSHEQTTDSQYGRQPSYEPSAETQPQYNYGRQASREQEPQYGYTRQPSREEPQYSHAQPHAPRPQVSDTHTSISQYPSNSMYQSSVPNAQSRNAYPYSSSNSQDYTSSYSSQPYSSTQTAPGQQPLRFAPRDNTTFASQKWEPPSPTPQFIPPPPPPIEQLQREAAHHSAPAVPAAPPPPPPPPPPPLPPIGGYKRQPIKPATSSEYAQDGTDGSHIPDVVQKQMAKGPGSKSPFAYAAVSKDDLLKFKQKHRRHKKPPAEQLQQQPQLQMPDARAHHVQDASHSPTKASGPISPSPASGVPAYRQFSAPHPTYPDQHPVARSTSAPESDYQYVPKPASGPANKDFDPTQSATYKMIHGITPEKKDYRQRPKPDEPEPEFKPIRPEDDIGYEEDSFKKFQPSNPNKQSRSFKLLQRYTKDEEDELDSAANREPSGVYEETHFTGSRESSSTIPSRAFRKLQKQIGANPDEILEEVKQYKPKPRPVSPEEPPRPSMVAQHPLPVQYQQPVQRQQPVQHQQPAQVPVQRQQSAPVPAHMAKAPVYEPAQMQPPKPESEMTSAELRAWKRQQKRLASGDTMDYQPPPRQAPQGPGYGSQMQPQYYQPQPQPAQWQPPPQPEHEGPYRWEPPAQHEAYKVQPTPEWQAKVEKLQQRSEEWEPPSQQKWQPSEPAPAWQAIARRKSNEAMNQIPKMQAFHAHSSSAPAWQTDVRQKRTDDDDVSGVVEEGFEPKLYRGGNIPSKAFKKLQIATGSLELNSSGATTKSSRSSSQRSTPSKELQAIASKPFPERQLSYEEMKAKEEQQTVQAEQTPAPPVAPVAPVAAPEAPAPVAQPPAPEKEPEKVPAAPTEEVVPAAPEQEAPPEPKAEESVEVQPKEEPAESSEPAEVPVPEVTSPSESQPEVTAEEEPKVEQSVEAQSQEESANKLESPAEQGENPSAEEQPASTEEAAASTPPQPEEEAPQPSEVAQVESAPEQETGSQEATPETTAAEEKAPDVPADDTKEKTESTGEEPAKEGDSVEEKAFEGPQPGNPDEKTGAD